GPGLQPAVQLVALTGGDLPGPLYARRGLTGGYPLVLMTTAMQDITRQMLEYEQRTIRRYRLRLSSEEKVRLMERLWELERRGRLDYRFLHDNCAFAVASSSMARWRRTGRCACPGASPRCSQRRRWMPSPW
ncbi:MAG TPA: DUF4105 domain-containing protein, partial [Longimicrobium sp.]|nr:DUF4105 domain-containing protein [Longimicrobium sp.]